jgi:REP element-mobilizing transposase RayT
VRTQVRVTAPRRIIPGTTYLVTRRAAYRQFLLKPSELTNGTVGYILAVAAARYGICLHAVAVLSNHFHLVLSDPRGELPRFCQYLDSLVARAMNAGLGRFDHFWSSGSYSAVEPITTEALVEKTVYTLANPVEAGLVATGAEWPGLWSGPQAVGGVWRTFERPKHFFREKGYLPAKAAVEISPPAGVEPETFWAQVAAGLAAKEREKALALEAQGGRFLGVRRVLARRYSDSPVHGEPRRELSPRIAGRDKWKRIEALLSLKSFLRDYRDALAKFRSGVSGVVFPHGTYGLRVRFGVQCAGAG